MGHFRKQPITFFVCSKCNLYCDYCYIPNRQNIDEEDAYIDPDFAVEGFKDYAKFSKNPCIRFFGSGEATLRLDLMDEITRRISELVGHKIHVELQTNGYFGKKTREWISNNVDILWISFDGPPEMNDQCRVTKDRNPTSDVVLGNIKHFLKQENMQVGVRATFIEKYIPRQKECIEFFHDIGLKWVCGAPAYSSNTNRQVTKPPLLNFAQYFVEAYYRAIELGMFYQTHLMYNFDEPVPCNCRSCTTPVTPSLTTDGHVSCCDWFSFGEKYDNNDNQQGIYGKWDAQQKKIIYDKEKQDKISSRNVILLGQNDCKNCEALLNCAGGCLGKVISVTKDLHKIDPSWCDAVKYLYKHIPVNQGLFPVNHS